VDLAEVPLVLCLAGLAAYTVLGGADFGAGLWFAITRRREQELREQTLHAMAPVWEANHVWLIFVLVVCWTAYPVAFASIFSTLAVPLLIAALGVILRGTAYALRSGNPSPRQDSAIGLVFSFSSVLTPFALGTTVGAIAAGRVPVGNAEGDQWASWTGATSLVVGVLAVAASAYMAAVFLAADAARQGDERMVAAFRRRAVIAGVAAGALALAGLAVLSDDAPELFDDLIEGPGLPAVIASALAGAGTLALVLRSRFEPARYTAAVAVAAVIAGWGIAQSPDFLPGLTVDEAAADDSTIVVLLAGLGVGALVLVPSLVLLFGLVLRGRFDAPAPAPVALESRPAGAPAIGAPAALGAAGALLLLVTHAAWLQIIGALAMLAAAGTALPLLVMRDHDR
jgi:cytochrome bd ubiquinol oxidase subunit II